MHRGRKDHRSREPCYRSVTCCRCSIPIRNNLDMLGPRLPGARPPVRRRRQEVAYLYRPAPDHELHIRPPRYQFHYRCLYSQPRFFTVTCVVSSLVIPLSVLEHCSPLSVRIDQSNILHSRHSVLAQPPRLLIVACQTSPHRIIG
ncbi:hypothetical protein CONLIGDRAFT_348826 [Coniochaeta ligniaria NRRL 30616]|uniref:Uncharacterized protein n=1 Tax=Coniochaeta ligniaria NRRL 30616 TaxID=1408157 RepID=A0A1J7JKT1_9PEZI|nr:hypothetical protein CONLIGDRAFT_348826 [Coniochaeta ligniaria NRRL 30616]